MLMNGPSTMKLDAWKDTIAAIGLDMKTADNPDIPYDDYYTSPAFSFIRFDVPGENLEVAMKLIVETLLHPRLDSVMFQNVKSAALSRASRETGSPRSVARGELDKRLYVGKPPLSPYGTAKSVAAITLGDVERFAKTYWVGNATVVTIDAGDVPEVMSKAILEPLQKLPAGTAVVHSGRNYQTVTGVVNAKAGKSQSYLMIASVRNNPPKDKSDAAAIAMDIFSTRIQQELRETRGWAYSIGAAIRTTPDAWIVSMQMGTKKSLLDSATTALTDLYQKFRTGKIDSSDVIRTKNAIAGRQRMREAARQYRAYAMGMALLDNDDPNKALPGYLSTENVTTEDVQKVISELPEECIIIKVE